MKPVNKGRIALVVERDEATGVEIASLRVGETGIIGINGVSIGSDEHGSYLNVIVRSFDAYTEVTEEQGEPVTSDMFTNEAK